MKINLTRLEQHISNAGITGADLARQSGLNQSTISNTRAKGSCDYTTLIKIADALGIEREILLPDELQEV